MKKWFYIVLVLSFFILATACSSDSQSSEAGNEAALMNEGSSGESGKFAPAPNESGVAQKDGSSQGEKTSTETAKVNQSDRKVIYTANLRIEVKDYQQTVADIQTQVAERGGYIVESNMSGETGEGSVNGYVTARIPQGKFREFIKLVEEGSGKVLESSISGQDVTEEYVDLESRLKSKQVVEKRLLSFMEQAEKTEDLLKISEDLAKVQGEIEDIQGRMNYLQNKTDLATVTVHIQEDNVRISGVNSDELNTWDQTKQQFLKSINFLISIFSGLIVFVIGSLPVLIFLAIIGLVVFLIMKKVRNKHSQKG
ncbi:DUF4349 domain-containing protein [Halobacillus naozhouensis]|uniref:DUF4349 domain-containing protein n=1 Tax=Halobacillus naozhouensis TaxID=554880 RepID=A0ABY8IZ30_9BACI|nr:DUF4349 domain-containing protein [Halobacillus naozhouensis]WFT74637.1 DUF4349 domain-containing protein [Halobacillus naozhouensis]